MSAKVTRLRSQRLNDIAEACRVLIDAPALGLKEETRDDLAEAYGRFTSPEREPWRYVMVSQDQLRLVLKAINASPRPLDTLRVWNAVLSRVRYDTGEVMAGGELLAEDADTTPQEVGRALTQLVKIGALTRIRRGRYAINPYVGWTGNLDKREAAALAAQPVPLRVVD